jgi:hypothetical protein
VALEGEESLRRKQDYLRRQLRGPGLRLSWSDPETTLLEAALSRGDRRLGRVIYGAWKRGARMDAWGGHLQADKWREAFADEGLTPDFYARRQLDPEEPLPWEHIDAGVTKRFLRREYERALRGESTPDCREGCQGCGLLEAFSNDACQGLGRPER